MLGVGEDMEAKISVTQVDFAGNRNQSLVTTTITATSPPPDHLIAQKLVQSNTTDMNSVGVAAIVRRELARFQGRELDTAGDGFFASFDGPARALSSLRLLPPCQKTSKVVIAGANYSKHLVEFGVAPPSQPIAFLKAYGALIGATDPIRYPPLTAELDYECELVVVIGDDDHLAMREGVDRFRHCGGRTCGCAVCRRLLHEHGKQLQHPRPRRRSAD
jgi:2-keto-4-pentenoate hydratase/2-oxohepta-3-ene-1,7-dioic acid hydratase in catechol pathway